MPDICNDQHRLDLENITAKFDFAGTIGVQTDMVIQSRHNGGQINLTINGSPIAYAYDWMAYHNTWVGGVKIEILSGGFSGDCTRILLRGATEVMSIALQEGWVDAPASCTQPTYDDLATGTGFAPGDTFSTLGIPCEVTPYVNSLGTSLSGDAAIKSAIWSCGDTNEVRTYSSTIEHDFSSMGGVNDMTLRVGSYGPGVNLYINGSGYWAPNWLAYNGATIGGCTISVPSWGAVSPNCGLLKISGHVDTLRLGGEETAIDCIEWISEGSGNTGPGSCLTYDELPSMPVVEFVPPMTSSPVASVAPSAVRRSMTAPSSAKARRSPSPRCSPAVVARSSPSERAVSIIGSPTPSDPWRRSPSTWRIMEEC